VIKKNLVENMNRIFGRRRLFKILLLFCVWTLLAKVFSLANLMEWNEGPNISSHLKISDNIPQDNPELFEQIRLNFMEHPSHTHSEVFPILIFLINNFYISVAF